MSETRATHDASRAARSGYPGAAGLVHDPHIVGKMAAHVILPWVHRIFSNLKVWALGVYHGPVLGPRRTRR